MVDGFDAAEALAGGCLDRTDAWAFVSAFAASWSSPLARTDGFAVRDVERAEARLGLRLPVALREAYALFGRRQDPVAQHNPLLAPDELLLDPSRELLVFRSENQGCAGWGVPLTDLTQEDPPVGLFADRAPDGWQPFLDGLSLACVETVLSEAAVASWTKQRVCQATPDVLAWLEKQFAALGLPPYPAWFELVVVGRTEAELQRALEEIPGVLASG